MTERRHAHGGTGWRIALGLALSLCGLGPAGAGPTFEGQGRVIAVDPGRTAVTIRHGGIQGLLPATQSEFPVQSASVIEGVRPGDRVRFTLGAGDESHGLLTVVALTPEASSSAGWPDRLLASVSIALGLLTLAAALGAGMVLWREIQVLQRRVVALDHEAGMLRGLVAETQDGVGQITRALEETATILRLGYLRELQRRLVPRSSPATPEAPGAKGSGEAQSALVVVQRGRGELYRAVEGGAAGPGLAVIWDRRRSERRRSAHRPVGHERRRGERRGSPPETWTRLGFQVVPESLADVGHVARGHRPVSGERGAPR
jgi:Cu/Ag efflux protein CusF